MTRANNHINGNIKNKRAGLNFQIAAHCHIASPRKDCLTKAQLNVIQQIYILSNNNYVEFFYFLFGKLSQATLSLSPSNRFVSALVPPAFSKNFCDSV